MSDWEFAHIELDHLCIAILSCETAVAAGVDQTTDFVCDGVQGFQAHVVIPSIAVFTGWPA